MHFALDNWQLSVPRMTVSASLIPVSYLIRYLRFSGKLSPRVVSGRLYQARDSERLCLSEVFDACDTQTPAS